MRHRPAGIVNAASIALLTVLAACGSTAGSLVPTDVPTTPSPSIEAPSPSISASPSAPAQPSAEPTEPVPSVEFSEAEQLLLERIRPDARVNCAPRVSDLPVGATAGVECRPAEAASQVAMYQFATAQDAARAYFARLDDEGVAPRSGDCRLGVEGDSAWTPGDDEGQVQGDEWDGVLIDGVPFIVHRHACFLNDNGTANVRATCGEGLYIGVLGRTDDLRELVAWSRKLAPADNVNTPSAPGICYDPELQ